MSTDLQDLDLSSKVSVPTSSRPIVFGSIEYLWRSDDTVVRAIEYMSSIQSEDGCSFTAIRLTFAIIAKAHFRLAQTDGVFALADAIKFLELSLVYALRRVT